MIYAIKMTSDGMIYTYQIYDDRFSHSSNITVFTATILEV
jgi:hypothetical protein